MAKRKRSKKQEEERVITHAIHGYDFSGDGKGVEIKAGSGIKDINPEITKGVTIHDPRNG
jgi:hypothetical protein